MRRLKSFRFALQPLALIIAVNLALSAITFAHDKGSRERVHDRERVHNKDKKSEKFIDKKSEKFINGHDARDGRRDGRGPRSRFTDKKSEKFINGHDARDGRRDGRGPRNRFTNRQGDHNWRSAQWRRRRRIHRRHN